jgi:hypothetical protein
MFGRDATPAEVAFVADLMRRGMPLVQAPDSIWTSIEREIAAPLDSRSLARGRPFDLWSLAQRKWTLATAAVLLLALVPLLWRQSTPVEPWDVVRLDARGERLQIGELLETDATSRAMIKIGEIGTVELEPNTRLALRFAGPNEHRLALARGTINAEIVAPPRVFFVETPASTVVDLGCAYTMQVDEAGLGTLRVTSGWASLEWEKRESLVPAGASCPTRPEIGPGTPAFDDATERLRQALLAFDFENGGAAAIEIVLAEARDRDTLTLWHLLSRVDGPLRARVFDRMAALTPLPAGVSRERALALDPATLTRWREELAWTW